MKAWIAKEQKHQVAIVAGLRTPFAKAGTDLKSSSAVHLGVTVVRDVLCQAEISRASVDEVVLGNAGTPANAANISRVIALRSGIPESVPAYTVHRNCASGMESIAQGCLQIGAGIRETMVVGGTESMSHAPLIYGEQMTELFSKLSMAKKPTDKLQKLLEFRPQWLKPIIAIMEGLTDPISGINMGQTAEILARDFGITRIEQDVFALESHRRCVAAKKEGFYNGEIIPVIDEDSYSKLIIDDVCPRENQTIEALAKLRPFFDKENGTVTPGNACPITDGAVALVLMNLDKAKSEGRKIMGVIHSYSFSGCEPKRMGLGPTYSTHELFKATGLGFKDIDVVELNEAFAAQVIANLRAMASAKYCSDKLGRAEAMGELDGSKLNVHGGAIALGHPVGATGARLVLTALRTLHHKNLERALATLCIGGGQGASFIVERKA